MKQINKEETEREYYARQSHEQLEIFLMNANCREKSLRDRLFLLSGCYYFGEQDGTNGVCVECHYNNRPLFDRCCLFQCAFKRYKTEESSREQHDCRDCKSFNNCISMVGNGSMVRCMYWDEIKSIVDQTKEKYAF